jgi:hypothetical protein
MAGWFALVTGGVVVEAGGAVVGGAELDSFASEFCTVADGLFAFDPSHSNP